MRNFAAAKFKMSMKKEEIKEMLRDIVNTPASKLTDDDKLLLLNIAESLGLERKGKSGCKKCWHDLAMTCWEKVTEEEQDEQGDGCRKYKLKKGVDLWFGSVRVNSATMTDELAERILAKGFEKKYFEKCE